MKITNFNYINLDKNWHRKYILNSLLRNLGLEGKRVPGIIYEKSNKNFKKYLKKGINYYLKNKSEHQHRVNGVIGCWIAHSKALECVTERNGITVVLEDDFQCQEDFFDVAIKMVGQFKLPFDIILFDVLGTGPIDSHMVEPNVFQPRNMTYPYYYGGQCIFVNNASIKKILNLKLNSPIMDYDGFLLSHPQIVSFVFYTGLSGQRNMGSDITYLNNNSFNKLIYILKWFLQKD